MIRGKKGFISIAFVIVVIIVIFLIYSTIFQPPPAERATGNIVLNIKEYDVPEISMDLSKDAQLRERYLRQTYLLSQSLKREQKIQDIDTGLDTLDKISTAVYSGSVIAQSLRFDNVIVRTGSSSFSKVYNMRIIEVELNNIAKLHNVVIEASNNYRNYSSLGEANEYLSLVGEHAGKTMYLSLRSDAVATAAFIEGLIKISRKAGIKIDEKKLKESCGEACYKAYNEIKDNGFEIITTILPFVDHALFEAFGILGKLTAPALMKATSFSENELQNTIIPKAKEFQQEILSQIEE